MLVALRLTIGWHFLYEGVWKIANSDEFSARPFLTQAKGPAAGLFYAMVPDLDGRQRLASRRVANAGPTLDAWQKLREAVERHFRRHVENRYKRDLKQGEKLTEADRVAIDATVRNEFTIASEVVLWEHADKLEDFLAKNEPQILAYFAALTNTPSGDEEPQPDQVPEEVQAWLSTIGGIEKQYYKALRDALENAQEKGERMPNPFSPTIPEINEGLSISDLFVDNSIQNLQGREILRVEEAIPGDPYRNAWKTLKDKVVQQYELSDEQRYEAERTWRRYKASLQDYLAANREDILAHFGSRGRFEADKAAGNNGAPFQKKRTWDRQQELRREVNAWLTDLDRMGENYRLALWDILTDDQKQRGMVPAPVPDTEALPVKLPFVDSRTELLNSAVTYGLTAIGLCLVVGLFTRLACLGGAAFLVSILLTQPPWPTIYPPTPEVVGHALVVDKNFVEMMAVLLLATTPVGRWGGLDFFLHQWCVKPFRSSGNDEKGQQKAAQV